MSRLLALVGCIFAFNSDKIYSVENQYQKTAVPLRYYLEKGPVYARSAGEILGTPSNRPQHEVKYLDLERPILPFRPLLAKMQWDLVLGVKDGPYRMYEFIRVDLNSSQSAWFTLDSKVNGTQFIGLPKNQEQARLVKAMADLLGIASYQADLEVDTMEVKGKTVYEFKTNRHDPEGEVADQRYEFTAQVPNKWDMDQSPQPNRILPKKRNSHAMNHSASVFLGVIDIHGAIPKLKSSVIKLHFDGAAPEFQKIVGSPVKSLISQTVAGLNSGVSFHRDSGLELVSKNDKQAVYSRVIESDGIVLQRELYTFDLIKQWEQLRSIEVFSGSDEKSSALMEFNPALPDYRYRLTDQFSPDQDHTEIRSKMTMAVDGLSAIAPDAESKKNKNIFFTATVVSTTRNHHEQKLGRVMVEVLPGNPEKDENGRLRKSPEWFFLRPLSVFIDGEKSESLLMGPVKDNTSESFYEDKFSSNNFNVLKSFHTTWKKRPHRMSSFRVISDNFRTGDARVELLGGTWGNGEVASDTAVGEACYQPQEINESLYIKTPRFALRQTLESLPLGKRHYKDSKGKSWGLHFARVRLPQETDRSIVSASLNGFKFFPGPTVKEMGITINGLRALVLNNPVELDGRQLPGISWKKVDNQWEMTIPVLMEINYSPELTRPYSGAAKQNFKGHSAYGQVEIIVFKNNKGTWTHHSSADTTKYPFRLGLPGKDVKMLRKSCEDTIHDNFLQGLNFKLTNASGKRKSRYLRAMSASWGEESYFHVDNMGEISWRTGVISGLETIVPVRP